MTVFRLGRQLVIIFMINFFPSQLIEFQCRSCRSNLGLISAHHPPTTTTWSRFKYLDTCWVHCHWIWWIESCCPQDLDQWLWNVMHTFVSPSGRWQRHITTLRVLSVVQKAWYVWRTLWHCMFSSSSPSADVLGAVGTLCCWKMISPMLFLCLTSCHQK